MPPLGKYNPVFKVLDRELKTHTFSKTVLKFSLDNSPEPHTIKSKKQCNKCEKKGSEMDEIMRCTLHSLSRDNSKEDDTL